MNLKRVFSVLCAFILAIVFAASPAHVAGKDKKQALSDDAIYDMLKRKLAGDPVVKGGGLDIDVKDGVVTLKGKVEQEKQKAKAEKVAHKMSGVKSVVNQIQVEHP